MALPVAYAQVTTVVNLGSAPASQLANGLGFNLTSGSLQEVQSAAAAGATHGRVQCGWSGVENQTAPPSNTHGTPQYTLNTNCATDLTNYATYGLHPTFLAAYGPPFHNILNVVIPAGASTGATSLTLQFSSGVGGDTMANLAAYFDNITNISNQIISTNGSYAGTLITGVTPVDSTHATVTLASAVTTALPANTTTHYLINEVLYVPALTSGITDTSVIAYANYAQFLASKIHAAGLTGEVELWNEPPWAGDPWDNRGDFYDTWPGNQTPGPQGAGFPNFGFAAVLQGITPPSGVTYNWGGTDKSGFNTLPNGQNSNTGVAQNLPPTVVNTESFHPYGNNPEDAFTSIPCLKTTLNTYPTLPNSWLTCNLISSSTSNLGYAVQYSLYEQSNNATYGIGHNITETGQVNTGTSDQAHQARFIMRQFLEAQAAGISPVQFYRLLDSSGQGFGFVNSSFVPYPAYTAIAGLMSDLSSIKNAASGTPSLPTIASYSGTYPLLTASFPGKTSSGSANSVLFTLWQMSNTTGTWTQLAQPTATPVTVTLPVGTVVSRLINLDTRANVSFAQSGQNVTFNVSDDPLEVLNSPATGQTVIGGSTQIRGTAVIQ